MTIVYRQLCTFSVDKLSFGLDVARVREVLPFQPMTRVPLARDTVRGLINLRGHIITAIDLRACLGFAQRGDDQLPMNVVIGGPDDGISLLVDSIGDVIEVPEDSLEAPPSTLQGADVGMIEAVCKLPGLLLLVLSPDYAINLMQGLGRTSARGEVVW